MDYKYLAKMLRVVDGDTVWLDVDVGFRAHFAVDVRLAYINAPERVNYTLTGIRDRAAAFIQACVPPGACCVAEISKSDKYGRWLAVIRYKLLCADFGTILAEGSNLNDDLVRAGLAQRYKP